METRETSRFVHDGGRRASARVRSAPRLTAALALLALGTVVAHAAEARPGGGSSFRSSGGSSSSSSSSPRSSGNSGTSSSFGHSSSPSSPSHASSPSYQGGSSAFPSSPSYPSSPSAPSSPSPSYPSSDGGSASAPAPASGISLIVDVLFSAIPGIFGLRQAAPLLRAFRDRSRGLGRSDGARTMGNAFIGGGLLFVSFVFLVCSPWSSRLVILAVLGITTLILLSSKRDTVHVRGTGGEDAEAPRPDHADAAVAALKTRDPAFSRVAFLDFVQALYTDLHGHVGTPHFAPLRAFVADDVLAEFQHQIGPGRVDGVVLGMVSVDEIRQVGGADAIACAIEANYTKHPPNAPATRYVVHEEWTLARAAGATSLEPAKMRVLSCANCGAPAEVTEAGACRYCGTPFQRGVHQWYLAKRRVTHVETFSTEGLGETVDEAGTDAPTLYHPALDEQKRAFAAQHATSFEAFESAFFAQTVAPVFLQMYAAWSKKTWNDVRHLLGDRLWESQRFWITAYTEKGLTNRLDDIKVDRLETVRVETDVYFEAVTVRVFAECKDYTVSQAGKVVGGSRSDQRKFSEYWTFVRSTRAKEPARGYDQKVCPNCGAPVDRMGQAAVCGYCHAKVSTGDFGWVLSLITQDEVYQG